MADKKRKKQQKFMRRQVRAAGRLATGGEERVVKGEIRASKEQQRRLGDYFNTYRSSIDQASGRTANAYSNADARMGQHSSAAADYAESLRQRLGAEARADAERRGVAYDPSQDHTATDANLARVNASNILRGVTASQGASQGAYLADKGRIANREEIEQNLREQARRRSLRSDLKELRRRRGDVMVQERGRLMEAGGSGSSGGSSDYQKFAVGQQRRSNRNNRRSFQRQKRLAGIHARNERRDDKRSEKWRNQGKGKGKGKGRPEGVQRGVHYLRSADEKKIRNPRKARSYLVNRGLSPRAARAAVRKARGPKPKGGNRRRGRGYRSGTL